MIPDKTYQRTAGQNQALHMVLLQYTTIEGYGADEWMKMAEKEWHQPVVCSVDDIHDAMLYMHGNYWTYYNRKVGQ